MQIGQNLKVVSTVLVLIFFPTECFLHKPVDCRFNFNLCIMNLSEDTVNVVVKEKEGSTSKLKLFSFTKATLVPLENKMLRVEYEWSGTDGCGRGCDNNDHNGNLFLVDFLKEGTVQVSKRIVPCKPCDEPTEDILTINVDYDEEFTDTLYYGR